MTPESPPPLLPFLCVVTRNAPAPAAMRRIPSGLLPTATVYPGSRSKDLAFSHKRRESKEEKWGDGVGVDSPPARFSLP